jgi:hypothetical protein
LLFEITVEESNAVLLVSRAWVGFFLSLNLGLDERRSVKAQGCDAGRLMVT